MSKGLVHVAKQYGRKVTAIRFGLVNGYSVSVSLAGLSGYYIVQRIDETGFPVVLMNDKDFQVSEAEVCEVVLL